MANSDSYKTKNQMVKTPWTGLISLLINLPEKDHASNFRICVATFSYCQSIFINSTNWPPFGDGHLW